DLIAPAGRSTIRTEAGRRAGAVRWVEARHAPLELLDSEGATRPLEALTGRTVAAFCGIGNPEGFRRTLGPLCDSVRAFRAFPDRQDYEAADVEGLNAWARESAADLVLTTQKDLVKLRGLRLGPGPLCAVRIGLEITAGRDVMEDALARLLENPNPR